MRRNAFNAFKGIALTFMALVLALGAARHAQAQDTKNLYPTSMVPLDQYLMGRDAEIALARSAAPRSVAKDATLWSSDGMDMKLRSKAPTALSAT